MNQDSGKMEAASADDVKKILVLDDEPIEKFGELAQMASAKYPVQHKRAALGNPDRKGTAVTSAVSAATPTPKRWPTLELYERIQIKGIWFKVTRIKLGSGSIGLRMLTTEEVLAARLSENW